MAEPSRDAQVWAAHRVIDMHEVGEFEVAGKVGRCKQCPEDGECPQLEWARNVLHPDVTVVYQP